MMEAGTPNKMKQWIDLLIGGVLSMAVAGFTIYFSVEVAPNPITLFLAAAFSVPAYLIQIVTSTSAIPVFSISLLFWFLAGVTIAYLVKTNKAAVRSWFWLYTAMLLLSVLIFIGKLIFSI